MGPLTSSDSPPPPVIFFGTPEFAAIGLKALVEQGSVAVKAVVTQPDRPAGRGNKLQAPPVKLLAESYDIPVLQPNSIKRHRSAFLDQANELGPYALGVVIAFGQILPTAVLNLPTHGCVNVHASLLPRWRGAAPIQRAILSGDEATGVCLMQMEAGLDTGPVFSRIETPIESTDTFESLHDRLALLGAALLERDVVALCHGGLSATPQPDEGTTYAKKIVANEALLDWCDEAKNIDRTVRGLSPVPGAFTYCNGKRLKVLRSHPTADPTPQHTSPGSVLAADTTLTVACGKGTLVLHDLQLEGKRRMHADELLKGNPIPLGTVLGAKAP